MRYRMSDKELDGLHDLLRFYGPYGPLRRMVTYYPAGGSLPLYSGHVTSFSYDYICRKILNLTGFAADLNRNLYAGGKGASLFDMFASSLSESIERGLGMLEGFRQVTNIVYGTRRELSDQGYRCLGPEDLQIFAPEQFARPDFPYVPFTDDTFMGWQKGHRLRSGEPTWVPAQLVAIYYPPLHPEEQYIGYSSSGGLASHIGEKEAILHGIQEIFERDAVNLHWYCKMPPAIVEFDRPPSPDLGRLLRVTGSFPAQPRFYVHQLDFPEIVVCTSVQYQDQFTRYKYFAGGGVGTDVDSCLYSAMAEFGQAMTPLGIALAAPEWIISRSMDRMFGVDRDVEQHELNVFIKILSYYGYKENFERIRWYVDTPRRVPLSSLPALRHQSFDEQWDHQMAMLDRHGIDPIVFDFTPVQLDSVRVMKVFIPELSPPFLPSMPMLGNRRYYELPERLGFADHRLSYEELNTDPMPYP